MRLIWTFVISLAATTAFAHHGYGGRYDQSSIAEIEGDSEQVAKAFGELFENKAYDEALQRVYQLQFLKKLMQSARAAEDRLLGY